jgi:hypothetical protein
VDLIRSSSRRLWSAFAAALVVGACASETEQPSVTAPSTENSSDVLELKLTPGSMTFVQAQNDGPLPAPRRIIAFNQAALIPYTGIQISPVMYEGGVVGWFDLSFRITGLSANIDGRIMPNSLPDGVYRASYTVRVPGTRNSPVKVNVTYIKGIYFADDAEDATGWAAGGLWNNSTLVGICNQLGDPERDYNDPLAGGDYDTECLPAPDQGDRAWWYGSPVHGDFDFGNTSGDLVSPEFMIPDGADDPVLGFRTTWETEGCCTFDRMEVYFRESGTNDETFLGILSGFDEQMDQDPVYLSAFLSMSGVTGQTGRLVFRFRTIDGAVNDYRGWIVDRIVVAEEAAFAGLGFPDSPNPGDYDYDYGPTLKAEPNQVKVITEYPAPGTPRTPR